MQEECKNSTSGSCTTVAVSLIQEAVESSPEEAYIAAKANAEEAHANSVQALSVASALANVKELDPSVLEDAKHSAQTVSARGAVVQAERELREAKHAVPKTTQEASKSKISRNEAVALSEAATKAAINARERSAYLDQQLTQATADVTKYTEAVHKAQLSVAKLHTSSQECERAQSEAKLLLKQAREKASLAKADARSAVQKYEQASVEKDTAASKASTSLSAVQTAEANEFLSDQRLTETKLQAKQAVEKDTMAQATLAKAKQVQDAASSKVGPARDTAKVAAQVLRNAEKQHMTVHMALKMAEAANAEAAQQLRLQKSRAQVVAANAQITDVELAEAHARSEALDVKEQQLRSPYEKTELRKQQSANLFGVLSNSASQAQQVYSNETKHLRSADHDAASTKQAAKSAVTRLEKAEEEQANAADTDKLAMREVFASDSKLAAIRDTEAQSRNTEVQTAKTVKSLQHKLKETNKIQAHQTEQVEQAVTAERKARQSSHAGETELKLGGQKEEEASENHYMAEVAFDDATEAATDAQAAVSHAQDQVVVAKMKVEETSRENARTKSAYNDASRVAEKEQDVMASMVATADKKHKTAKASVEAAAATEEAKQSQEKTSETEEENAEQKADSLLLSQKRAREAKSKAEVESDKANHNAETAAAAHAAAVEKLESAQADLLSARKNLASVESHSSEVASADKQAVAAAKDLVVRSSEAVKSMENNLITKEHSLAQAVQRQKTAEDVQSKIRSLQQAAIENGQKFDAQEEAYRNQAHMIRADGIKIVAQTDVVNDAADTVNHAVASVKQRNEAIQEAHKSAQEQTAQARQATNDANKQLQEVREALPASKKQAQIASVERGEARRMVDEIQSQIAEQERRKVEAEQLRSKAVADYQTVEARHILEKVAAQKASEVWKNSHAKWKSMESRVSDKKQEELAAQAKVNLLKKGLLDNYGVDAESIHSSSSEVVNLDAINGGT
jgi:hypothetical protein